MVHHRPGGVVRVAQVDQIDLPRRKRRNESVFFRAGEVDKVSVHPAALIPPRRAAACHVGIDVDRVRRIGHRDDRIGRKEGLDVRSVAFRSVADEHFIHLQRDAALLVVFDQGLSQISVTLLVSVAGVGLPHPQLFHLLDHRFADCRRKRLGGVSDPQPKHLFIGISLLPGADSPIDLGKEISACQVPVCAVDRRHLYLLLMIFKDSKWFNSR